MVDHQVVTDPSLPCCPHQPGARRNMIQKKGLLLSYPGPSLEKLQRLWRGNRQQSSFLSPTALCLLTLLHPQGPKPGHMLALRVALVGPISETNSCSPHLSSLMASSASLGTCAATPASYKEQVYHPGWGQDSVLVIILWRGFKSQDGGCFKEAMLGALVLPWDQDTQ